MGELQCAQQVRTAVRRRQRQQEKLSADQQSCYVDSSRNIAVNLDSSELASALKEFIPEVNILLAVVVV